MVRRKRVTYRKKLTPCALVAAIGLAAAACDGGDGGTGTRPNEAAPAESDPFISIHAQLDEQSGRNLFEVEADHGTGACSRWTSSTVSRGQAPTRTDPREACPCRLPRPCRGPVAVRCPGP